MMPKKTKKPMVNTMTRPSNAHIRETMQRRNSRMFKLTVWLKAFITKLRDFLFFNYRETIFASLFIKSLISTIAFSIGLLVSIFYLLMVDDTFSKFKEIWILIPILFDLTRNLLMTLLSRIRLLIDRDLLTTKRQQREAFFVNSILLVLQSVMGSMTSAAIAMFLYYLSNNDNENKSKKALVLYAASIVTTVVVVLVFGLFIMVVKLFSGRSNTEVITNSIIGIASGPLIIILVHQLTETFNTFIDSHGHLIPVLIMLSLFISWALWEKVAYSPLTASAVWNGSLHLIIATLMSIITSSIYEKGQRGPEKYLFIYQLLISGVTMNLIGIYAHHTGRMLFPVDGKARISEQVHLQREAILCTIIFVVSIIVHSGNFAVLHQFEPFKTLYHFNFNFSFLFIFYLPISLLVLMTLIMISHIILDNLARSRDDPDQVAIPYVTVLSDSIATFLVYLGYHLYVTR